MSGDVDMRAMVENIRKLGQLPQEAAKLGAPLVQAEARKLASQGVDPTSGAAWEPMKRGKAAPLRKAAEALTAVVLGTVIQLRLAFPYSLHDRGKGHAPQRRILPRAVSGVFQRAIVRACQQAFTKLTGREA